MKDVAKIIDIAVWYGKALGVSSEFFKNFTTEGFGIKLPDSIMESSAVKSMLTNAEEAAKSIEEKSEDLESAATSGDESNLVPALATYILGIREYFSAVYELIDAIKNQIDAASFGNAEERADAEALAANLSKGVVDATIFSVVESYAPQILYLLKILGLAEWQYTPAEGAHALSRDYVKRKLQLDKFKTLINNPEQHFKDTIGWGTSGFDPTSFFELYSEFFHEEAAIEIAEVDGDPYLEHGFMLIRRQSNTLSPPGLQIEATAKIDETEEKRHQISDEWGIGFHSRLELEGKINALLKPPLSLTVIPPEGEISGELTIFLNRNPDAGPLNIIGGNSLLNLSVEDIKIGLGLEAKWDAVEGAASVNPMVFGDISGGNIKIGASGADSFIGNLLSALEIEGNFDLGLEWTAETGLRIKASGGIEIQLPIHKDLGIVEFESLYLILNIKEDGTLNLETSTSITGKLGPLEAAVDRLGAQVDLIFPDNAEAEQGIFGVEASFKPPNGVGLSLDTGVVVGGGYLYLDYEKGEYAGALELTFSEVVSLKAIGIITTKMPDGSDGFSLLIIINAEFGSGIQLGFGFTLLGVGGLIGLNRTMNLQPLAEGVRTGAVNNIMFPANVVENAPRIISDLRAFFPAEEGTFLIGPMAKLGWGTPALISVSIGIIIEIPGNIAILGVLKVVLPTEEAPLVVLQINFIGAIEFDKERLWFFASMYNSRILYITLEGEMGLLVAWGNAPDFVVSVGGFHPSFNPPPLPFPSPKVISFNVLNESWGKIRVMGYFAVTSNTVQFGAKAELYFGFSAFKIEGHIGFDALFQFSPFYFVIQLSASLSIKVFGIGLFGIRIKMSLEGPTPWRAKGTGSISLWLVDIEADFDFTWGEQEDTILPAIELMPVAKAEFEKTGNWKALLSDSGNLSVTLRELEESSDLVLHPVGTLEISQRAIPLDITLDKFGSQKPSDVNKFSIEETVDGMKKVNHLKEDFPLAQFQEMENAEKLSRPSFEKERSGMELSVEGEQIKTGKAVKRIVRYETIVLDTNYKRVLNRFWKNVSIMFSHLLSGNAVSKSQVSFKTKKQFQPHEEKISVAQQGYSVANLMDNKAINSAAMKFESEALAREYLKNQINRDPSLADKAHVIPQHELNTAA